MPIPPRKLTVRRRRRPIEIAPCEDAHCTGMIVTVACKDKLARIIAYVLLQEYRYAEALASGARARIINPAQTEEDIERIVRKRLLVADGEKPYNRDGLLMQLIMWIAATIESTDDDCVAPPHVAQADKGQDMLILHGLTTGDYCLSICEDKATKNPRKTVTDKVWPEFCEYEAGDRDDELTAQFIILLRMTGVDADSAQDVARSLFWSESRKYRARITCCPDRDPDLFDGYSTCVPGPDNRRRGDTLSVPGLRSWMSDFAEMIKVHLYDIVSESDGE